MPEGTAGKARKQLLGGVAEFCNTPFPFEAVRCETALSPALRSARSRRDGALFDKRNQQNDKKSGYIRIGENDDALKLIIQADPFPGGRRPSARETSGTGV